MAYPTNKSIQPFRPTKIRAGDIVVLRNGATCKVLQVHDGGWLAAKRVSGTINKEGSGVLVDKDEAMSWEPDGRKSYPDCWQSAHNLRIVGVRNGLSV